jgi:YfiR/HmsC-like
MKIFITKTMNRFVIAFLAMAMLFSFKLANNEDEHTIKALFIYNFTKHVEWPKGKISDKFIIGVVGNSPVYEKLNLILKDRKIKDLPVELRRISATVNVEACDVIFVSKGETSRLKAVSEISDFFGILVISEEKSMAKSGSSINFKQQDDRMKFELNDSEIKKAGLKISTQLYELATASK